MEKKYRIERSSIIEILDDIEKFLLTIDYIEKDKNIKDNNDTNSLEQLILDLEGD